MKEILLEAPDSQLDASMKPLVQKWSSPPKAIEILEVLDHVIFGALASGLVTTVLQNMYTEALIREKIGHDDVVKLATWRPEEDRQPAPVVEAKPQEQPCALPEGHGLEWVGKDFFGAGIIELHQNGIKVGWCVELLSDDKVVWSAYDNRTSENGCNPILAYDASLSEASEALVKAIVQR